MCINEPVKWGHLSNQDSFMVSGIDRFDCSTVFLTKHESKFQLCYWWVPKLSLLYNYNAWVGGATRHSLVVIVCSFVTPDIDNWALQEIDIHAMQEINFQIRQIFNFRLFSSYDLLTLTAASAEKTIFRTCRVIEDK